jgi:hypothetical protein
MASENCGKVERPALVNISGLLWWYGLAYSVSREVGYDLLFDLKTIDNDTASHRFCFLT